MELGICPERQGGLQCLIFFLSVRRQGLGFMVKGLGVCGLGFRVYGPP